MSLSVLHPIRAADWKQNARTINGQWAFRIFPVQEQHNTLQRGHIEMNYEMHRAPMAVILAAGTGSPLGPLTDACPKSLLSVGGSVILERMIRNCLSCGISQFVLVLGQRADQVRQFVDKTFRGIRVTYVINDRYRDTNTGYSLMLASSAIGGAEFVKFDADVVFDVKILRRLVDSDQTNVLCFDRNIALGGKAVKVLATDQMQVLDLGKTLDPEQASGTSIGIEKISPGTGPRLFAELAQMMESVAHLQDNHAAAYARLVEAGAVFEALDITGLNWTQLETEDDFTAANAMFGTPIVTVSRGQQRAIDEAPKKAGTATHTKQI